MRSTLLSRIVIYRSIRNASASRFLLPSILLDHVSQLDYKFPFFIFLTWFKSVFIFPACISVIHIFDLFGKKKVQKTYLLIIYNSVTFWFYNMVPITKSGPFMSINDFRPTALHCTQYTWSWVSPLRSRHSQDIFSWNGRRPHISQDENAWQYNSPHGLNLFYNCFICFNVNTK